MQPSLTRNVLAGLSSRFRAEQQDAAERLLKVKGRGFKSRAGHQGPSAVIGLCPICAQVAGPRGFIPP